jgi:hypothetical protein
VSGSDLTYEFDGSQPTPTARFPSGPSTIGLPSEESRSEGGIEMNNAQEVGLPEPPKGFCHLIFCRLENSMFNVRRLDYLRPVPMPRKGDRDAPPDMLEITHWTILRPSDNLWIPYGSQTVPQPSLEEYPFPVGNINVSDPTIEEVEYSYANLQLSVGQSGEYSPSIAASMMRASRAGLPTSPEGKQFRLLLLLENGMYRVIPMKFLHNVRLTHPETKESVEYRPTHWLIIRDGWVDFRRKKRDPDDDRGRRPHNHRHSNQGAEEKTE